MNKTNIEIIDTCTTYWLIYARINFILGNITCFESITQELKQDTLEVYYR
jgi:hypothetical protein